MRESSGTDNEKEAEKILRTRLHAVAAGVDDGGQRLRYDDLRKMYLRECLNQERKSLPRRSDGTLVLDRGGLPVFNSIARLDDFFLGCRVKKIRTPMLDEFVAELKQQGFSNGSVNRSLSALRAMFSLAKKREMLRDVPVSYPMLPEAKPRKGFFEHHEYRALLGALPDYLQPLLAIGFSTGMRSAEIRGLRWEQIDFLNGLIRLDPGETKNSEGRSAPMTAELAAILRARYATRPANFPTSATDWTGGDTLGKLVGSRRHGATVVLN